MARTFREYLATLPIERQQAIKEGGRKLIAKEAQLRELETMARQLGSAKITQLADLPRPAKKKKNKSALVPVARPGQKLSYLDRRGKDTITAKNKTGGPAR